MPSEHKKQRQHNYVSSIQRRLHASATHNTAIESENARMREELEHAKRIFEALPGPGAMLTAKRIDTFLGTLEPDWTARFRATLKELKDLPEPEFQARVQAAKEAAKAAQTPTS
jgi:hypothetical protein